MPDTSTITPSAVEQIQTQAPGFYRLLLGAFEITVLLDSAAPRRVDEYLSKPEEVRRVLDRNHQPYCLEISTNAVLINAGGNLILVDAGVGELFGPQARGRLLDNLRLSGYRPEQISAVLLTHMAPNHCGGLSIGGEPSFPNALAYVDRRDSKFWLDQKAQNAASRAKQRIFRGVRAAVAPYVKADKLRLFDGATTLFPGVQSIPAFGHTPGHTTFLVESEGRRLLLWGDVIHVAEVQFDDWTIASSYDADSAAAIVTRRRVLTEAADQGYIVSAAHVSFPGLGRVCVDGDDRFRWLPLPYAVL